MFNTLYINILANNNNNNSPQTQSEAVLHIYQNENNNRLKEKLFIYQNGLYTKNLNKDNTISNTNLYLLLIIIILLLMFLIPRLKFIYTFISLIYNLLHIIKIVI